MRTAKIYGIIALVGAMTLTGCFGRKKQTAQVGNPNDVAPDKALYERSLDDIARGHNEVARLTLNTLINTYPDSEYLAKAKLAMADSYYKEGGTASLTQAANEYNDFITFFPFLDEAAYAQMQIGMCHYRRVEKPDRDRTEAQLAEQQFQIFLQKYPQSNLVPQVEQQLRDVQELLAEGDFRIAQFYSLKGSQRAAAGRLLDVVSRYPLYSKSDEALWMLANIYEKNEKTQYAGAFYSRIVQEYPLSPLIGNAKERLGKLGMPVPQPDPAAVARMQKEQSTPRHGFNPVHLAMGAIESRPDMSMAAHSGSPNMSPPDEDLDLEKLVKSSGFNLNGGMTTGGGSGSGSGNGSGSGAADSGTGAAPTGASNGAAVEIITPGSAPTPGPAAKPADPSGSASATTTTTTQSTDGNGQAQPASNGAATGTAPASNDANGSSSQPCPTDATSASSKKDKKDTDKKKKNSQPACKSPGGSGGSSSNV